MTKRQAERYMALRCALFGLGFTDSEIETLIRAQKTLHSWGERECNGDVERDEDTGLTYATWNHDGPGPIRRARTADRETGAIRRIDAIVKAHSATVLGWHYQTDPRGCALYILRPGDVPAGADLHGFYSRGLAICY